MTIFQNDTRTTALGDGRYQATLSDNWSIGNVPNGGYSMAVLANAMRDFSSFDATVLMSANYCGRLSAGALDIQVERMTQSRQFDRLQINAEQDGKTALRAWGTLMQAYQDAPGHERPAPQLPLLEDCVKQGTAPNMSIQQRLDMRFSPETAGWLEHRTTPRSQITGWLRLAEPEPWTPEAMMLVADAFPPSIFASRGMTGWVPTIELNVQILKLPSSAWLKCVFHSSYINGNLLVEDGEIWDENDDLIATSRQLAQFRTA